MKRPITKGDYIKCKKEGEAQCRIGRLGREVPMDARIRTKCATESILVLGGLKLMWWFGVRIAPKFVYFRSLKNKLSFNKKKNSSLFISLDPKTVRQC